MDSAEIAVLRVLADNPGKVLSRHTVLRLSGLQHCAPRRCDTIVSSLRRMLGEDAIVTVRGRGWMLQGHSLPQALSTLARFSA